MNHPFHDNGGFVVTVIVLYISLSRLEVIKISACMFEIGLLVVACLVGAIYAKEHTKKKKIVQTQNSTQNMIRNMLVQNRGKTT